MMNKMRTLGEHANIQGYYAYIDTIGKQIHLRNCSYQEGGKGKEAWHRRKQTEIFSQVLENEKFMQAGNDFRPSKDICEC